MYELVSEVSFSKTDVNLELSLDGLVDYLQDVSIFDSEQGGATVANLYAKKIAWLLSSWQIVVDRMPMMNEKITVSTVPYEFKGFFGYRNFLIKNEAGEELVKAAAIWTLIDMNELKPVRLTPELVSAYEMGEKLEMDYKPRKIKIFGVGEKKEGIRIRKSQIDSNDHLNNAEYVSMILDFIPDDKKVKELRVEYRNAVYLGEMIYPLVYTQDNLIQISMLDEKDDVRAVLEVTVC